AMTRAFVVYLKTKPETAAKRTDEQAGTRPMMIGEDTLQRERDLFKEREPFYAKAHAQIETDRATVEQVAAKVVELARARAGW
ncbi:MAG: shikimate kinase, partial [Gemmatimonadales bacterium]